MLEALKGKEVSVYFLDGTSVVGGVLKELKEGFAKYRTEYQELYIPFTAIREISVETKVRERSRVGFAQ